MILDHVPLKPLWAPSRAFVEQSNLKKFQNWLFVKKGLYFRDYYDLWEWSVTDLEDFWESIWQFYEIKSHSTYWNVLVNSRKDLTDTQWFTGASISYTEHIFRHKNAHRPALLYQSERGPLRELSWRELEKQVIALATYLRQAGVGIGDKVVAVLPNGPYAVAAFLATNSVGATWSICPSEMNTSDVLGRFQPIKPKVLFAADGYIQNGKPIDKLVTVKELMGKLPTLKKSILIPHISTTAQLPKADNWSEVLKTSANSLEFTPVSFEHPLWTLFISEVNGQPKAIAHSVGGCLLEHLKILNIHQNIKPGERFFWQGSTDSMAWNFSVSSMLMGAIPVLYEGPPIHTNISEVVEKAKVNHFGATSSYLTGCMSENLMSQGYKFSHLQSVSSIDGVLSAEGFEGIYQKVKKDIWLISLHTDTHICSSLIGGVPTLPVYPGEPPHRLLGCKLDNYGKKDNLIHNGLGETTLSQPIPSMPL